MNNPRSLQFLFLFAVLLLASLYIFPLWKITLLAPQYPNGVEMHIHIDKIGGKEPGTLQNINILNHYIGMKPIEPDSIPELKILPIVIISFLISGILIALTNNKYLFAFWACMLIIGGIIGMYDFYLWEYDYGHNLDPKAPMSFDESFQPPLIGKKDIINFTAISLPHIGGWCAIASIILSSLASYLKFKHDK